MHRLVIGIAKFKGMQTNRPRSLTWIEPHGNQGRPALELHNLVVQPTIMLQIKRHAAVAKERRLLSLLLPKPLPFSTSIGREGKVQAVLAWGKGFRQLETQVGIVPRARRRRVEDVPFLLQEETTLQQAQVAGHRDVRRVELQLDHGGSLVLLAHAAE